MTVKQFAIVCMPQEGSDYNSTTVDNQNYYEDYRTAYENLVEGMENQPPMLRGEQPMSIVHDGWIKELWVITRDISTLMNKKGY
jgi:hypothetical protein